MLILDHRRQLEAESDFVIVWEFRINPRKRRAFESVYGPDGDWARLFQMATGHLRTELIRDCENPNRYLTLDHWKSRKHYQNFKKQNCVAYKLIDEKCEALTIHESEIGQFSCLMQRN